MHTPTPRSPLVRLLQKGQDGHPGHVEVYYHQQWRTLFKAQRQGYLDQDANLTDKARALLAELEGGK